MRKRLTTAALWLALGLGTGALALGAAAPALAQAQNGPKVVRVGPGDQQNSQPWSVNCASQAQNGELSCTMAQTLLAQGTNQRVLAAAVYRPQANGSAIMRLNLPHGILLQKGVDVWVDLGSQVNYPITIADQNGSYANVELTGNMLVTLQGGAFLNVAVAASNGDRVEFQLSLKGFTSAFGKL